ncbi:MAG: hypothetical protein PW791_00405 [Neorhizobium sp.]|nr:hypothetical protein [Neorhizobium sp.]
MTTMAGKFVFFSQVDEIIRLFGEIFAGKNLPHPFLPMVSSHRLHANIVRQRPRMALPALGDAGGCSYSPAAYQQSISI